MSAGLAVRGVAFAYKNRNYIKGGVKYVARGARYGAKRAGQFVSGNKRKIAGSFVPAATGAAIYGGNKRRKLSGRKGKAPTRRVGSYGGRFKAPKKAKMSGVKGIKNHAEIYGTCETKNAVYHGFNTCGGRPNVFKQYAEQLLKSIMLEQGISLNNRDSEIYWGNAGNMEKIELKFSRVDLAGSITNSFINIPLGTATSYANFDSTVGLMMNAFMSAALQQDRDGFVGWALFEFQGDSSTSRPIKRNYNCSDAHFELHVKSTFKVQNQTQSDPDSAGARSGSTDVIDANPLEGKVYRFKSGFPKVRQQFLTAGWELDDFQGDIQANGLCLAPADTGTVYDTGNPLFSPFMGNTMFSNCVAQGKITLQPGKYKSSIHTYTFSGSVRSFIKAAISSDQSRFTMGDTILYGMEPAMRTSDNELVKIAYNLEYDSKSSLKKKIKMHLPQSNISAMINGN